MVVEASPRLREQHTQWTTTALRQLVGTNTQVRIRGWLMFDQMNPEQVNQHRITLWEIHPITRLERQRSDSSWATLDTL